eukprot:1159554-Pelagomonas_calceolata.AAC.3
MNAQLLHVSLSSYFRRAAAAAGSKQIAWMQENKDKRNNYVGKGHPPYNIKGEGDTGKQNYLRPVCAATLYAILLHSSTFNPPRILRALVQCRHRPFRGHLTCLPLMGAFACNCFSSMHF